VSNASAAPPPSLRPPWREQVPQHMRPSKNPPQAEGENDASFAVTSSCPTTITDETGEIGFSGHASL
jgi:hypothetical protein